MNSSEHVRAARAALNESRTLLLEEISKVNRALAALGPDPSAPVSGGSVLTIKAMVGEVLRSDQRPFKAAEVADELERLYGPVEASDLASAIRTSLVSLVQDGEAERVSYGQYMHSVWQDPEGAPTSGSHKQSGGWAAREAHQAGAGSRVRVVGARGSTVGGQRKVAGGSPKSEGD